MNFCPPKPGFTDISRIKSTSSKRSSINDKGLAGFKTKPD